MAKEKLYRPRTNSTGVRNKIKFYYTEKFFNKWMSKYEFIRLNYQQKHYFMRKLWDVGSVAVSSIKSANPELAGLMESGEIDMGENAIILTPWAPAKRFNIYDFPTHIRLINTRGVKFITQRELRIDDEAVIIWAQKNHKSVYSSIEAKLNELIDIEMKKRVARKAQSQPWMFAFSPEDFEQAKILQEQMENDEPYMFVPFKDVDKAKALNSGAPYIVDKLEQDRQKVENDILTMMGVNNVGVGEKKEHLIVDEVNANNQDIQEQSNAFQSEIESGWNRAYKALGYYVQVIDMNELYAPEEQESQEEEEQDVEEN